MNHNIKVSAHASFIARYLFLYIFVLQTRKIIHTMKKTINVVIGGCSFIIDEDAYNELSSYLDRFRSALDGSGTSDDVMDGLEVRIADMLKQKLAQREVVDSAMVRDVTGQLGYPESINGSADCSSDRPASDVNVRKLYRDPDSLKIAGVCSGLSLFLGVDVTVVRILFLIALFCGSAGFWVYVALWIAAPEARTPAEKCEMRGIPATAENMRRFTADRR